MVVIHVNGAIQLAVLPGYGPLTTRATTSADTAFAGYKANPTGLVYNGWTYNYFRVTVIYATSAYTPSLVNDPTAPGSARTDTLWVVKGEDLLVSRTTVPSLMTCSRTVPGELPCGTPNGPDSMYSVPSYKLSGTQTISVERLDDRVTLTASPSTGGRGRAVTFTPQYPAWDGAVQAATWTWTPDGGVPQAVACYSASPCVKTVNESGTMDLAIGFKAHAAVPELTRRASVHVTAVDCPTGDSLLDLPEVRKALSSLADSAHMSQPQNMRREVGGYFYHDPTGDSTFFKYFPDDTADACTYTAGPIPNSPPPGWIVAGVHVHPQATGDSVYPGTCKKAPQGGKADDFPSPQDQLTAQTNSSNQGRSVPEIILAPDWIHRTVGPDSNVVSYRRRRPGCTLP